MANSSEKEVLERYKKYAEWAREKYSIAPEEFLVDTKSVEKFVQGLGDCKVVSERPLGDSTARYIDQHNDLYLFSDHNENYQNEIEQNDNLVILSPNSITVTNHDKTLTFWNPMLRYEPTSEMVNLEPESLINHAFCMTEVTPDGWFYIFLDQNRPDRCGFDFYRNADILDCGCLINDETQIETVKYDIAHGNTLYSRAIRERLRNRDFHIPLPQVSIDPKDFALLANKIYRKGLPYVVSLARNGGVLEITDEDRKFFEEASRQTEETVAQAETSEESQITTDPTEPPKTPIPAEQSENTNASDLEEAIQSLRYLSSMGIELTDSQKDLLTAYDRLIDKLNSQKFMFFYNKLKSDEFQQYKAGAQEREKRLQAVREQNARDEEAKMEWNNSPENPSNIIKAQAQMMSNQLDALNNVSQFMPLTDFQEESRRELETFFDMKEKADAEDHSLDSQMSEEIRSWYQDEYGKQETGGKKAK